MASVVVERRGPKDDEELFRLYGDVFGTPLADSSRGRWRWQYLDNPANADGPEIWIARDGEALLGQYASMPVRLWWGDAELRSSWGMDVFVNAAARGRGVGAQLFTTWSDNVEVALGLGLTPSSYGLFKKLRYDDVGPIPFYQKVLDARAVATRRLGKTFGPFVAPALRAALAVVARERAPVSRGVNVSRVSSFGAEYDALWDKARVSYAMCVRRDAAYLNWKYVAVPHRGYDLLEARRGETLVGFAVARQEDYRGTRLGWIVDVFAHAEDDGAQDALVSSILAEFRATGVARVQCFAMNRSLGRVLRRRGFLAGGSPMQFCVRARGSARAPLADLERWHVVFGDSDMDR